MYPTRMKPTYQSVKLDTQTYQKLKRLAKSQRRTMIGLLQLMVSIVASEK